MQRTRPLQPPYSDGVASSVTYFSPGRDHATEDVQAESKRLLRRPVAGPKASQPRPRPDKAEDQYRRIIRRLDDYVTLPFCECADDFLEWVKQSKAPATFRFYQRWLNSFCKTIGPLTIGKQKPFHVTGWAVNGGSTYRNNCIRAVQRCCNWFVKQGYIERSPLVGIEKPSPTSRDEYLTPIEPMVLRYEYPLWSLAPDMVPTVAAPIRLRFYFSSFDTGFFG